MSDNSELLEQTKEQIRKIERMLRIYKFKQVLDKLGLGDGTTRSKKAKAVI